MIQTLVTSQTQSNRCIKASQCHLIIQNVSSLINVFIKDLFLGGYIVFKYAFYMLIINMFEEDAVLSFIKERRRTFSFRNPILIGADIRTDH